MKKRHLAAWAVPIGAAVAAVPAPAALGQGADVSLCDIHQVTRWGNNGAGITAYSIGTTSVNVGNVNLNWIQNGTNHPVISQNMYRVMNGRIEQIGQSWLKHSFCALQIDSACDTTNCPNQGGCLSFLAPGCQDPYSAARNGSHSLLGPKYQVNANAGTFIWPHPVPPFTTIGGRLQVHDSDLGLAGGVYLVEGQYVAFDDSSAGNQDNNNSYRLVSIGPGPTYAIGFVGGAGTQFQRHAMNAWLSHGNGLNQPDPEVVLTNVEVPGEGFFIVGSKVSDNGNGTYHYEYAIQNVNSHRSAREFIVPIGTGAAISNVGFHDVDYHSGDGEGGVTYDGTDWASSVGAVTVSWSTSTFAQNPNANALRWATMYNYRFDADTPPVPVTATIGLFRAGSPTEVTFEVAGPDVAPVKCPWDLVENGAVDINDLLELLANWGNPYDITSLIDLLAAWGACP